MQIRIRAWGLVRAHRESDHLGFGWLAWSGKFLIIAWHSVEKKVRFIARHGNRFNIQIDKIPVRIH